MGDRRSGSRPALEQVGRGGTDVGRPHPMEPVLGAPVNTWPAHNQTNNVHRAGPADIVTMR